MKNSLLQLNATELNKLIFAFFEGEQGFIPVEKTSGLQKLAYKARDEFAVLNVTKDSRNPENQRNVPYIGEVFEKIFQDEKLKNKKILIPMWQCCGFLGVSYAVFSFAKRAHIILVELDLKNKKIIAHDSQGSIRHLFYTDRLKGIAASYNFLYEEKNYHAYGKQTDNELCGYYVYDYIKMIVNKEPPEKLATHHINIEDIDTKKYFLEKNIPNTNKEPSSLDCENVDNFDDLLEKDDIDEHNDLDNQSKNKSR